MVTVRARSKLAKLAVEMDSDKWGSHWYADHYERHFAPFRWKRIKLMEIGIGGDADPSAGGGSLRMWERYFRRGQIIGVDIHDKSPHAARRISIYKGDQGDSTFLKHVVAETGLPDIIIDDGSHLNHHVIGSFEVLFPLLKPGGIYAIEDTQSSYWPKYGGGRGDPAAMATVPLMEFFKKLTDGLNFAEFLEPDYVPNYYDQNIVSMHFYHNLIFIYKDSNDEGSNCVEQGVLKC